MHDPRKYTIRQLVVSNNRFSIPRYQRGYDWKGESQVKDLFSDLIACSESKYSQSLFLGSMIFDVSQEKSKGVVEIIDGQQRFTTIMLTLIAARDYVRSLGNEPLAVNIQADIKPNDPYIGTSSTRLEASESIRDVFDIMCDYEWDGSFPDTIAVKGSQKKSIKRQVARVESIYHYAQQQIEQLCQKDLKLFQSFMKQLYHDTYIIRIDVEDKAEAFEIFERTNARGKPLEVSDLLKNFLFSKDNDLLSYDMESVWERISNDSGNNIIRMLKYFWVSRRGHVPNRDLYRSLRTYAGEIAVETFVTELQEFSAFYKAFNSDEIDDLKKWFFTKGVSQNGMYLAELTRSCAALKLFNVTQPIPLIFAAVNSYMSLPENDRKPKSLINLLRYIESYHFVNNRICRRIGNEVERIYASYSDRLFNGDPLFSTLDEMLAALKERTAERAEFVSKFEYLSYESSNDRQTIRYIFDRLANSGMKDGQRVDLIDYDGISKGVESSYNIEHIFSQSIASETDSFIHEIGNLLVIPKQINGILQNDDFATKLDKLGNPANYNNKIVHVPPYVQEFVGQAQHLTDWTETEIHERTLALADQTYQDARFNYNYK